MDVMVSGAVGKQQAVSGKVVAVESQQMASVLIQFIR